MTRYTVTGTHPYTGQRFTITANSATEAIAAEDGMVDNGWTDTAIEPIQ